MTDNDSNPEEEVIPAGLALVAAFVDGEDVSADALKAALETPESREYFVELLALRASVHTMESPELMGAVEQRRSLLVRARWMAAVLVLGVSGGYLIGHRQSTMQPATEMSGSPVVIDLGQFLSAPAPTHVIVLEPGVNWTNKTGGK